MLCLGIYVSRELATNGYLRCYYIFIHVATTWISRVEWYSIYRSEMRVSDRKKGVNVWGTALTVHGVVFNCRECLGSGGWVELCGW